MVHYDVRCSFTDPQAAEAVGEAWVRWLHEHHLADVKAAGAVCARVVRVRAEGVVYEARYVFPSRDAFEAYQRDHGPRLREEGLERFPLERGLVYARRVSDEA